MESTERNAYGRAITARAKEFALNALRTKNQMVDVRDVTQEMCVALLIADTYDSRNRNAYGRVCMRRAVARYIIKEKKSQEFAVVVDDDGAEMVRKNVLFIEDLGGSPEADGPDDGSEDESYDAYDMLGPTPANQLKDLLDAEKGAALWEAIDQLKAKERTVLIATMGLDGEDEMPDEAVADQMGLHRVTITNLRKRAIANLRKLLKGK